jgi:uncharacterized protein YfaS (alpha-2-macroglobulin family)
MILLAVLFVAISAAAQAAQPTFYLSTDRIFASNEDAIVRVEGRQISDLSMRIYRITDPLAFFKRQENPYQARGEGERASGARQLAGLFMNGMRREVSEVLKQKSAYRDLPDAMRDGVKEILGIEKYTANVERGGRLTRYPLVREMQLQFPEQKQDWAYHLVRLPIFEKGVYLIEGMKGKEAAYTIAMVSDLALISRHAADTAVFYASDRISGKAASARLTLFKPAEATGGAVVPNPAQMQINANVEGYARHQSAPWLDGRVYVFAEGAGGVCLHDATFYASSSFGVSSTKAYIYTERPLYQPGQTVYFRAAFRDYEGGYRLSGIGGIGGKLPIELYTPSGKLIAKSECTVGNFATAAGEWAIPENAEQGVWRLVVVHAGKRYEAPFKIEHYVKPPFEVAVATDKAVYSFGDEVQGKVNARYFFGDAVRGAAVQYIVYRAERVTGYSGAGVPFGWYIQDNEFRGTREERVHEGAGETDDNGMFAFRFKADASTLRSDAYSYRVEARITDRSRRLVRGSGSFSLVQGKFWLHLETSKEYFIPKEKARFAVSALDYSGNSVSAQYQARITFFRWDSVRLSEPAEKVVRFDKRYALPKDAAFEFTFDKPGHYQIEILAKDAAGNAISTSQFVWVAGNADKFVFQEGGLRIVADKKLYASGDTAELLALSPVPDMQLLYTIEGDTILESGVLTMQGNSLTRKQRITDRMVPNAWFVLHAVYNDRVYTTRHQLLAPPKEKFLDIQLTGLKERYRPGEKVSGAVTVRDSRGRGARAALSMAAVDQAIYALQPRMVIDIERFFYHAHRNTVIGGTSYTTRFYGYAEEDKLALARHLRQDAALADLSKGSMRNFDESRRGNFRDLAYWNADIVTDADGKAEFNFTLPDNITTWKLDLIALDDTDRVGSKEGAFIARKDLFLRAVVPTVLYEKDQATVSATVHNLIGTQVSAKASLVVKNGKLLTAADQQVLLSPLGERLVSWRIEAGQATNEKLELEFNLVGPENDAEIQTIDVKPFAHKQFQNFAGPLLGVGKRISREFTLPAGANLDDWEELRGGLSVYASPSLINLIEDSLRYLVDYPYGCVEQTLSRFVPNLLVQRMVNTYPFRDQYLREVLTDMANMGLDRLRSMQNADGSWGWFAGDAPDLFMTAYTVYSLALARNMGYWSETEEMLEKGSACLNKGLREQSQLDPLTRAFALLALRQQGAEINSMIRSAMQNTPKEERLARAFLGMAALDTELQEQGLRIAEEQLADRKTIGDAFLPAQEKRIGGWKGDDDLIDALLLRVLAAARTQKAQELSARLINGLLARRQGPAWSSTLSTAFVFNAFLEYARAYENEEAQASVVVIRVNGTALELSRVGLGFEAHAGADILRAGKNTLDIEGNASMYYNAALRYFARQESFAAQDSVAASITRSYHLVDAAGSGRASVQRELKGDLPHGKLVLVRLKVRSARAMDYVMIEDPLVSGAEYVSERDDDFVRGIKLNAYLSHQRETDRTVFFLRTLPAGETEICYLIRPFLEGEYRVLPATVGSMYSPDTTAAGASALARVRKD